MTAGRVRELDEAVAALTGFAGAASATVADVVEIIARSSHSYLRRLPFSTGRPPSNRTPLRSRGKDIIEDADEARSALLDLANAPVTRVSPNNGSTAGGTTVTVAGTANAGAERAVHQQRRQ